ncbi:Fic family protein [Pantoea sp. OXWO6B1]|nr:Fic family protein [Pantoea sp. OXWO6B1]OAE06516.1 cell filamentation protein [Pantoea sp. OXWO6B1]
MFDPFGDFETAGYLRNVERIKDIDILKRQEHIFFEANIEDAMRYLQSKKRLITYQDFLHVHHILFGDFYPWAGKDRLRLGVGRLISKGKVVQFEASELCQKAVEWGLSIANKPALLRQQPGKVMGIFAWGHPFLDGNGRTMLLIHTELCRRAGFLIKWHATNKNDYLNALTSELNEPQHSPLDNYLKPLISELEHSDLLEYLKSIPGLDGSVTIDIQDIAYKENDHVAQKVYEDVKQRRNDFYS